LTPNNGLETLYPISILPDAWWNVADNDTARDFSREAGHSPGDMSIMTPARITSVTDNLVDTIIASTQSMLTGQMISFSRDEMPFKVAIFLARLGTLSST